MNQDPQNPINPIPPIDPTATPAQPTSPISSVVDSIPSAPSEPTDMSNITPVQAPALDSAASMSGSTPTFSPEAAPTTISPDATSQTQETSTENFSAPLENPTLDPTLLQQAINDVPDASLPTQETTPTVNPDTTSATPTADFSSPSPDAPSPTNSDSTPPSVAFNDPAQTPDTKKPQFKKPAFLENKKINPVIVIVAGSAIVIIGLVLLIAFAM